MVNKTVNQLPAFKTEPGLPFGYNCPMDFFTPEKDLQRMTPEETRITSLCASGRAAVRWSRC
jgi:hypothetical protein